MIIPGAQPYKLAKFVFTGKAKAGMQDDLVMTLMLVVFWAKQFIDKTISNVPYDQFNN